MNTFLNIIVLIIDLVFAMMTVCLFPSDLFTFYNKVALVDVFIIVQRLLNALLKSKFFLVNISYCIEREH